MEQSNITAIVILYRSKHLIKKLIDNIRSKITNLDEIVLVDNSKEDLSEFEGGMVKVFHPGNNLGYGAAINLGVKLAKNENIVAMNPDIEIENFDFNFSVPGEPLYLISGIMDDRLEYPTFPHLFYDTCRLSFCNLSKAFAPLEKLSRKTKLNKYDHFQKIDWFPGSLIVTNKSTLTKLGGFDESYFLFYEEVDLCMRAHHQEIPVLFTPSIRYRSIPGKSSVTDVSDVKLVSEVDSFLRYHKEYSDKRLCRLSSKFIKYHSSIVMVATRIAANCLPYWKIKKKYRQYKIYYESF